MRAALWIAFLANLTAYPLTNGLLPYAAQEDLRHHPDRTRISVGELCDRLADRFDHNPSLVGGIRVARLISATIMVRDAAGVCADADHAERRWRACCWQASRKTSR